MGRCKFDNVTFTKVVAGSYIAVSKHTGESVDIRRLGGSKARKSIWIVTPRTLDALLDDTAYRLSFKSAKKYADYYLNPDTVQHAQRVERRKAREVRAHFKIIDTRGKL